MFTYLKPNKTAGYSGFIMYNSNSENWAYGQLSVWMIPGTYFLDWDN